MTTTPQTKLEAPASIVVIQPNLPRCPLCQGPACFKAEVSSSGSVAGGGYDHAPTCPKVVCPCGLDWCHCVTEHTDHELDRWMSAPLKVAP